MRFKAASQLLKRNTTIAVGSALFLLAMMGLVGFELSQQTKDMSVNGEKIHQRLGLVNAIDAATDNAELMQTDYGLIGAETYRAQFKKQVFEVRNAVAHAEQGFQGDRDSILLLREIERLTYIKLNELDEEGLAREENRDLTKYLAAIVKHHVSITQHSRDLDNKLEALRRILDQRLFEELRRSEASAQKTSTFIICGSLLSFVIIIITMLHLYRELQRREETEAELRAAEEKARLATKAKGDFLANMSHEIRTPLNGIIGMSDLLLETQLDTRQKDLAKIVSESGSVLLHLINDILDHSKIEAGKLDLEMIQFPLVNMIETQTDIVSVRAREKGVSIITCIDPRLSAFYVGDPGRIGQVLLNLLGNAIKFTDAPGTAYVRILPGANGRLRFEIKDTGIGMTDDVRARLFSAFVQADSSMSRRFGGTGLGLSICHRLVEIMDGEIGVESRIGFGSTFWFEIPLEISQVTDSSETHETRTTSVADRPLTKLRVLVATPNEFLEDVFKTYLGQWSIESVVCHDLTDSSRLMRSALEQGHPFDIAYIDHQLCRGSQVDHLVTLKADDLQTRKWPKLVLISGDHSSEVKKRLPQVKFADHLQMPFKQMELLQTLQAQKTEGASASLTAQKVAVATETPGVSQLLVLVAEDNQVNQLLISMQLQKLGVSVHLVANGREAVEATGRIAYDLVFMDCQMPEMDGYEATRQIRLRESVAGLRLPIVALTANAMRGDAENCLAAGMDDYLAKPAKKDQIQEMLLRWLGSRVAVPSPAAASVAPAAKPA